MFETTQQSVAKRHKIMKVFAAMAEGAVMTYDDLAKAIDFPIDGDSRDPQFAWAVKHAPDSGIVIRHVRGTREFRRMTKQEIASDSMRPRKIRNQAKAGLREVSVAMASNDKNVQAIASAKAARFSLIRDVAPTSNRRLASDKV